MSDPKAERLARIRAANAQRRPSSPALPAALPATDRPAAVSGAPATAAGHGPAAPRPSGPAPSAAPACGEGGVGPEAIRRPPALGETTRLARDPHAPEGAPGQESALTPRSVGLLALAAAGGALCAIILPLLIPGLWASLLGPEPKAYWYLARSTAFVAYGLLWLAMALGLTMTSRLTRLWPGGGLAFDLHEHASLLGLAFGLFHALILLGDRYMSYSPAQILIPFASGGSTAGWVGLGQVGLYLMGVVGLSFYVRPLIGRAGWRLIHFLSFATFGLVLLHGVMSGSDSGALWARALYWLSGGSLLFLTVYRVLVSVAAPARGAAYAGPPPSR